MSTSPDLSAIPRGNGKEHLRRAREIIASGSAADLAYAALELRFSLEVMTYDKLRSFAQYMPKSFLARTWQPPQLLKAMKQLDENADQTVILHMTGPIVEGEKPRDEEYALVGEHKAFSLAWLRKHYNKLGAFLHLQPTSVEEREQRDYLSKVADEIAEAQKGSILGMWLAEAITFTCDLCGESSTVSAHHARTEGTASCLNPSCELEHKATTEDGKIFLTPLTHSITCKRCDENFRVQHRHLSDQLIVACPHCKADHGFRWVYGMLPSKPAPGESHE